MGRWKLPSLRRSPSTASESSSKSPAPETPSSSPPVEFLCQISGALMADPVIISSGQTFERACIQACIDLAVAPPPLAGDTSSLLLIPNSALRAAILNWCDRSGHPRPLAVDHAAARLLVHRLAGAPTSENCCSISPKVVNFCYPSSSSPSSYHSSSSSYSSEIVEEAPAKPSSSIEEEILVGLNDRRVSEQLAALGSLRLATRESKDHRTALCTPRVLAAVRPLLLSRHAALQVNATAALVNLSFEPANKVPVVRSGAVPSLVEVVRCGSGEAKAHAAAALFGLSTDGANRAAMGALGAIPPLLRLFCCHVEEAAAEARADAGMAIYYLSLAAVNRTKLARAAGGVKAILGLVNSSEVELKLKKVATMVICSLAGNTEGRGALIDAGAVAVISEILSSSSSSAAAVEGDAIEYCVAAMYGMSKGGLRFRGLASLAEVETAIEKAAAAVKGMSETAREMARRVAAALRGEEEFEEDSSFEGSVSSDNAVSLRRRWSNLAADSGDQCSVEF